MPETPDAIIIGGGVIGLSIARQLAIDGRRVTLLERGVCGAEASWAGAGVLAPCNPHRRDTIADLRQRSLQLYPAFCKQLREETGIDPEYEPCGELELALDDASLRSLQSDADAGSDFQTSDGRPAYQFHQPDAARKLEQLIHPEILGAMECRLTAQIRNPRLLRALKQSCTTRGVEIHEQTEVTDFVRDGSSVVGVRSGALRFLAAKTILCAGAWSSQISATIAPLIPVYPVRGQMILMKFDRRPFHHIIARGKTYLVPRRDGHVLLGATEEHESGFNKRTTATGIAALVEKGMKLVPMIRDAAIVSTWAGLRPGTPDENPYIGPIPGFDGLLAATGHFRAGLILTPITAEIIAAWVKNSAIPFDVELLAPGRR